MWPWMGVRSWMWAAVSWASSRRSNRCSTSGSFKARWTFQSCLLNLLPIFNQFNHSLGFLLVLSFNLGLKTFNYDVDVILSCNWERWRADFLINILSYRLSEFHFVSIMIFLQLGKQGFQVFFCLLVSDYIIHEFRGLFLLIIVKFGFFIYIGLNVQRKLEFSYYVWGDLDRLCAFL